VLKERRLGQNSALRNEETCISRLCVVEVGLQAAFVENVAETAVEASNVTIRRKLVWVESQNFQGWACSECAWAFKPLGPLVGQSIDEMKMHYERQRDSEFTSHVCAQHPRSTKSPR
jgi:hypothetical protein